MNIIDGAHIYMMLGFKTSGVGNKTRSILNILFIKFSYNYFM